jgi:hypothetical protein
LSFKNFPSTQCCTQLQRNVTIFFKGCNVYEWINEMFTFGIVPTEGICQISVECPTVIPLEHKYVSCGAVFPVSDRNTLGWLYARIVSLSVEYGFRPHPFFVRSTRKENLLAAGTDSPSRLHAASKIASPSNKVEHRSSNVLNNSLNIQYCSKYCSHLQ